MRDNTHDADSDRPKVAVVVVHGVSDQRPDESVRAIANLLMYHARHQFQYSEFVERSIRIPVHPLYPSAPPPEPLPPDSNEGRLARLQHSLNERGDRICHQLQSQAQDRIVSDRLAPDRIVPDRSSSLRTTGIVKDQFVADPSPPKQSQRQKQPPDRLEAHEEAHEIDKQLDQRSHDFTCDFLQHYQPQDANASFYNTICLEAERSGRAGQPDRTVHLYEMYWADLSRLGTGFVEFFSEFYQILFHLSSLGQHTIDLAALEYKNQWWQKYSRLQSWAGRMLSLPIPLLNLYLLIAVFLFLPALIPVAYVTWIARLTTSLFLFVGIAYLAWRYPYRSTLVWFLCVPVGGGVVAVLGSGLLGQLGAYRLLTLEWGMVLAIPIAILITRYAIRRPGANLVALILAIGVAPFVIWFVSTANNATEIIDASFKTAEVVYFLMWSSWQVFNLFYVVAVGFGLVLVIRLLLSGRSSKTSRDRQATRRATRAAWTANFSLWLPAVLFLCVTISLWAALSRVASSLLPRGYSYSSDSPISRFVSDLITLENTTPTGAAQSTFFDRLILEASPAFLVILCLILIAVVFAILSFLPSAWSEIFPPDPQKPNPKLSLRFGVWLSNGFDLLYPILNGLTFLLAVSVAFYVVVRLIIFFDMPIALSIDLAFVRDSFAPFKAFADRSVQILAALLTASATSLLLFGRRLNDLTNGLRGVLDVVLDVDNYLRLQPRYDNPRARIFARYGSLLRYLCQWNDPQDGKGYDALVIVAHSQGTVITADLLRFLKREPNQGLERLFPPSGSPPDFPKIPIYFFSMGSPLRQLYGAGFPHLYNWVLNDREIPIGQKPQPETLGVEQWVNTFRSGDYIGRYLWRSSRALDARELFALPAKPDDQRREFCLGAGAHTHYWDATAERVAEEINRLIDKPLDSAT